MKEKPKIIIENCDASNNGADGIRIVGNLDAHVSGTKATGNAGKGISVSMNENDHKDADEKWWKKPIGIVTLSLIGGVLLLVITTAIKRYFPSWF